jgi:putative addiction module component (TIGR02574 family)
MWAMLLTMVHATLMSRLETLSAAERLELIGAVWQTLGIDDAPVTAQEQQLLDARLADADAHPQDQSPWSEVQTRLQRQLP